MDNALRTISYIADIGNIVVLMARRRMPRTASQDCIETTPGAPEAKKQYKMICHVFESEDVSSSQRVFRMTNPLCLYVFMGESSPESGYTDDRCYFFCHYVRVLIWQIL